MTPEPNPIEGRGITDADEVYILSELRTAFELANAKRDSGDFAQAAALAEGLSERLFQASSCRVHGDPIKSPEVSVIVVSYEPSPLLAECLRAIKSDCRDLRSEIVLVDNGNPETEAVGEQALGRFAFVKAPFPVGASAGRNIGTMVANAPHMVFIDDDGVIEPGAIRGLLMAHRNTGAAVIRGRVIPLTMPREDAPAHYDLGTRPCPSFMTCEGISFVQKDVFQMLGGFDPLLYGHEGIEFCGRAYRFLGPTAFLYEPGATLRHDFAVGDERLARKLERHSKMAEYVTAITPQALGLHHRLKDQTDASSISLHNLSCRRRPDDTPSKDPVSIITTAFNAEAFLHDYTISWQNQTHGDFEIIFVDDGSTDATLETLRSLWQGDGRLRIVETEHSGRGDSLNTALRHATHDVCLIADADDISRPDRIEETLNHFQSDQADFISFITYNEDAPFRQGGFPRDFDLNDMPIRSLFGMPGQFPTYAFRKSAFSEEFSIGLAGGVDCDWLTRNLGAKPNLRGTLLPIPMVYYRRSPGQISAKHSTVQKTARKQLIEQSFGRLIGALSDEDRSMIEVVSDQIAIGRTKRAELASWVAALAASNDEKQVYDPISFRRAVFAAFEAATAAAYPAVVLKSRADRQNAIRFARKEAQALHNDGQYSAARQVLRSVRHLSPRGGVRMQLLASARYPLVRWFARGFQYSGTK